MGLIAAGVEAHVIDRPGGIFVRPAEQISNEDRILLQSVARAIISDRRGTLADQIDRRSHTDVTVPRLTPTRARRAGCARRPTAAPRPDLLFSTGWADSRRMAASTSSRPRHGQVTPAPWVNVLANPHFGTVISESGHGLHLERERPRIPPHARGTTIR